MLPQRYLQPNIRISGLKFKRSLKDAMGRRPSRIAVEGRISVPAHAQAAISGQRNETSADFGLQ
jgi:hypothetical protein